MISPNSRYAQSTVIALTINGQDRATIVPGIQQPYTFNYTTYQVTALDRIDNLAYSFYQDASKWFRIADANPQILDWSNVPVGTIIRVPFL